MIFTTNIEGGAVTLNITGELDAVSVPDLRPVLDDLITKGHKKIVIDLSGLRLIDSSGVGAIVYLFRKLRAVGGTVSVRGAADQPLAILRLLKLDQILLVDAQGLTVINGFARVLDRLPGMLPARLRDKHFDRWLPGYLRHVAGQLTEKPFAGHRHLLFAFCDHFEPRWKQPSAAQASERVKRWTEGYPRLAQEFRDADGRSPRHSFFFPGEEYAPEYLDGLAQLARAGLGEVELHLHHDNDTPENLRQDITRYLQLYAEHGHLSRDGDRLKYAFIHGNWCLANARSDGRWCGVDEELPLLHQTGCYADFTFPAVPDESQPAWVNRIYWPDGDLGRRRAYDQQGRRARVGEVFSDRLLMIEGPLAVVVRPRKKFLRIENGDITGKTPGNAERVRLWQQQNIHVDGRPEWVFVKVHTHGTQEHHADAVLGAGARQLHQALGQLANDGQRWSLHYVTAREMYNVAIAAMDGKSGNPADYFDYRLKPPPVARQRAA